MTASIYDTNLKLAGICDVFFSVCGEKDMKFGKLQAVAEASICLCGAERLPHIFIKLDLKRVCEVVSEIFIRCVTGLAT